MFKKIKKILIRKFFNKPDISLTFKKNGGYQIIINNGPFLRSESTAHLIIEACIQIKDIIKNNNKNITLPIDVNDFKSKYSPAILAYSKDTKKDNKTIYIPDFVFWSWPECGISDYSVLIDSMLEESRKSYLYDTLFWIGNPDTHKTRYKLLDISKNNPKIDARSVKWNNNDKKLLRKERMSVENNNYISLPDHCKFKYLIDLQGRGYSGRLKVLLFSGRPLFIQERKWKEFFFEKLIDGVHYIKVKEDLSDLELKLDWAESHPDECMKIAKNAQEFAIKNLTRQAAIRYMAEILKKYI